MRVSVIRIGEQMPGEGSRPHRMSMLAKALIAAGHEPTWWTSNWNHQLKRPRDVEGLSAKARDLGIETRILEAPGYPRNVSFSRFLHHEVFGAKLLKEIQRGPRPDAIWCCFPTIAATRHLAQWASANRIPFLVDVLDLSPDVFISAMPRPLATAGSRLLGPIRAIVGRSFAEADAIVGISQEYLDWGLDLAARQGKVPPTAAILPLGYYTEASPQGMRSFGGTLEVAFSGTLGRSFDAQLIVKAARLIAERRLPIRISVAGDGEHMPYLRDAAASLDTLRLLGWLDNTRLVEMLASSHVGLMAYAPRATQGLPHKIFEYMAQGLALVNGLASEAATLIEARQIGWNFEPGNAESLVTVLSRLDLDQVRETGLRARAVFDADYDMRTISTRMVTLIEDVAMEAAARAR